MEEVRMQTTQTSLPGEPNYSSDPYYDAECKIREIIEKHYAALEAQQTATLSGLWTEMTLERVANTLRMAIPKLEAPEDWGDFAEAGLEPLKALLKELGSAKAEGKE